MGWCRSWTIAGTERRSPKAVRHFQPTAIVSPTTAQNVQKQGLFVAEQPTGKLAVILHADVVGSTALVQRDERRAHERITSAFKNFAQTIQEYGGQVHEIRGDALVAEFARASDAVCAAIAGQKGNTAHNKTLDDDIIPEIRIGISLGEVVIADNTITGAGVVLAQRVEQLAEPGGMCITEAIREATSRKRFLIRGASLRASASKSQCFLPLRGRCSR